MFQSPEAVYDCLAITKNLEEIFNGVTHQEIQRLSFLACIISLFAQRPTSEWGYTFSHTKYGTPFSSSLSFAMESLVSSGVLKVHEDRHTLSEKGQATFRFMTSQSFHESRSPYIEAACGSAAALPPGTLARGLNNEPTVFANTLRDSGSRLLSGAAIQLLYEHFHGLKEALPDSASDLLSPAVLWLLYVSNESLSERLE